MDELCRHTKKSIYNFREILSHLYFRCLWIFHDYKRTLCKVNTQFMKIVPYKIQIFTKEAHHYFQKTCTVWKKFLSSCRHCIDVPSKRQLLLRRSVNWRFLCPWTYFPASRDIKHWDTLLGEKMILHEEKSGENPLSHKMWTKCVCPLWGSLNKDLKGPFSLAKLCVNTSFLIFSWKCFSNTFTRENICIVSWIFLVFKPSIRKRQLDDWIGFGYKSSFLWEKSQSILLHLLQKMKP